MIDLSCELFSGKYLPPHWASKEVDIEIYRPAVNHICPGMELVGQLTRSTNTVSFILRDENKLYVCQFAPPQSTQFSQFEERNNPRKFLRAKERMDYLIKNGIQVPTIVNDGTITIQDKARGFIVMNFVEGISADRFLAKNPHESKKIYFKFGEILAQLSNLKTQEVLDTTSFDNILGKVNHSAKYICDKGVITAQQVDKLIKLVKQRLIKIGNVPLSYVHLDPFPTNIHISFAAENENPILTLMDIEAIQLGHPVIEGFGRAIMTGIYDWNYIIGGNSDDISGNLKAFVDGYSKILPIDNNFKEIGLLMKTCRLIHLPQSIMYELKRDITIFEADAGSFDWSSSTLRDLIENSDI